MMGVRAAVTERPRCIAVHDFPMPDPQPGAVLMKVRYSGICGTDKHTFRGESKQYAGTPNERDLTYPLICGHENVGTVAALGGTVRDSEGRALKVGDRIVPAANVPCGTCHFCRNGYPYYFCEKMEDYGNSLHCAPAPHLFGGWAEYMYLLPGTPIFRVPDDLPDNVAVLTEIMAVTHGVETALAVVGMSGGNRFGGSVAVLGCGPLGLCHLIKAKLLGAATLIASDRFPRRLAAAQSFGANLVLPVEESDSEERIARAREATGGRGPDIVLSCSGVPQTFVEALRMVRMGGVVVEAGTFVDMGPVAINPNADICTKNVTVIGVGGETATAYLPSMRLMAANLKRLPLESFVSHRMTLDRAQAAVELAQTGESIKVVMAPNGEAT
ncbi:MAG: alcohol dehydrogenase catalytic domain-containing protein [Methylobacteriaceae bacterium]|nr:alcohol dehydrogenase catalytic domain-containing protein [Methylobacteriaceae bacterium]MBV9247232.1 alcohol dehydrogenase catalytic domain-containing protein [Methylobacteriaceae bacterium]